jgi:hypothetical protein
VRSVRELLKLCLDGAAIAKHESSGGSAHLRGALVNAQADEPAAREHHHNQHQDSG